MTARSIEFFAAPEEQSQWLRGAATVPGSWCLLERPRIGKRTLVDATTLSVDSLGNQFSPARLLLGRSELSAPVWRQTATGEELDFVRSRAVLFEPSIKTPRELVAGRLAIMRRLDYEEADIDDVPLAVWYKQLVASLRGALGTPDTKLFVVAPGMPRAPARGTILVSRAARDAARHGAVLKQFHEVKVVFELA